jgi:hypothetical protein
MGRLRRSIEEAERPYAICEIRMGFWKRRKAIAVEGIVRIATVPGEPLVFPLVSMVLASPIEVERVDAKRRVSR